MVDFSSFKVTIIGMGFLMEYIFPCFRANMPDHIATNVIGTTVDPAGLEEKEKRLGCRILLGGNDRALREMEPTAIFFAPPPSVVSQLMDETLVPYFAELRAAGKPLPMLFVFPPFPAAPYYLKHLGDDVKVVHIIPNMISSVGNEPVIAEACNLITYPEKDNWTRDDKALVDTFFTPMGYCLEVPPHLILRVLSAEMSAHPVTELANIAAIALNENGLACTYADTASAMRAYHQRAHNYTPKKKSHASSGDIPDDKARALLEQVFETWYSAILEYLVEQGFPRDSAQRNLNPRYDLFCYEAQLETREEIIEKCAKDATKGGMLELYMQCYFAVVEPKLYKIFKTWPDGKADPFDMQDIGRLMRDIIPAVVERAHGLAKGAPIVFTPRQQAIMAGVLIKETLALFGDRADKLLWDAVERYGLERGSRMAQRAQKNGDPLDMVVYRAYSEWPQNFEGFSRELLSETPYLSYKVKSCPYCTSWDEVGLTEYGPFYCRVVDEALIRGFNPDLRLDLKSRLSDPGSDSCEFHWLDCEMSGENKARQKEIEARLDGSGIKDFCYHTAHVYSTLTKAALALDKALGEQLVLRVREGFAKLTSYQELFLVLAQSEQDFNAIT